MGAWLWKTAITRDKCVAGQTSNYLWITLLPFVAPGLPAFGSYFYGYLVYIKLVFLLLICSMLLDQRTWTGRRENFPPLQGPHLGDGEETRRTGLGQTELQSSHRVRTAKWERSKSPSSLHCCIIGSLLWRPRLPINNITFFRHFSI